MSPPMRRTRPNDSPAQPRDIGGQPPNPRSFSLYANGPSPGSLVSWRGMNRTTTRGIGPFGEARRSGCPPAEPYPAGDKPCSMTLQPRPAISATVPVMDFKPSHKKNRLTH
jgi:hypothetical protein